MANPIMPNSTGTMMTASCSDMEPRQPLLLRYLLATGSYKLRLVGGGGGRVRALALRQLAFLVGLRGQAARAAIRSIDNMSLRIGRILSFPCQSCLRRLPLDTARPKTLPDGRGSDWSAPRTLADGRGSDRSSPGTPRACPGAMIRAALLMLAVIPLCGQTAAGMLARLSGVSWEAPPTAACAPRSPIQMDVYATVEWTHHCADTRDGVIREDFFYVFGEPARIARLRVDMRPVDESPENTARLLPALERMLTARFGTPTHE